MLGSQQSTRGGTRTHLERCVGPPPRPASLPGVPQQPATELPGRIELPSQPYQGCILPLNHGSGCPRTESNRVGPAYGAGASPAMLRGRNTRTDGVGRTKRVEDQGVEPCRPGFKGPPSRPGCPRHAVGRNRTRVGRLKRPLLGQRERRRRSEGWVARGSNPVHLVKSQELHPLSLRPVSWNHSIQISPSPDRSARGRRNPGCK